MEIKFRAPHAIDATCFRSCVCAMAWRFHAIDATLSPRPRRLDGVEAHENHCLISTQRSHVVHISVRLRRALAVRFEHADQDKDLELAVEGDVVPLLLGRAARDLCANQPVSRVCFVTEKPGDVVYGTPNFANFSSTGATSLLHLELFYVS